MKSLTKLAVITACLAVIILSIVVTSVAWFTSNSKVNANDVSLETSSALTVEFARRENSLYKYDGQTGVMPVGEDAPYAYDYGTFDVNIKTSSADKVGYIKVQYSEVMRDGNWNIGVLKDFFTVRAAVYVDANGNGGYAFDAEHEKFVINADTGDYDFVGLFDWDSTTGYVSRDGAPCGFASAKYTVAFTYVFLPEAYYKVWLTDCEKSRDAAISDGVDVSDESAYLAYVAQNAEEKGWFDYIGKAERPAYVIDGNGAYVGVTGYVPYNAALHVNKTRYTMQDEVPVVSDSGNLVAGISGYELYDEANPGHVGLARYSVVKGFPYQHPKYMNAVYTFDVICSVEEADATAAD